MREQAMAEWLVVGLIYLPGVVLAVGLVGWVIWQRWDR